jgi:hypothetical protein
VRDMISALWVLVPIHLFAFLVQYAGVSAYKKLS